MACEVKGDSQSLHLSAYPLEQNFLGAEMEGLVGRQIDTGHPGPLTFTLLSDMACAMALLPS